MSICSPSAEFDPVIGGEVCPQVCHKCVFVITQRELLPARDGNRQEVQHYNHLYLSILILYVQNKETGLVFSYVNTIWRYDGTFWVVLCLAYTRLFCVTRFSLVLHKFWSNKKNQICACVHDFNCNHLTAVFDAVVKYSINTHLWPHYINITAPVCVAWYPFC